MEESQYFIQIRTPTDVRKGILSSSKQIIQVLQRYERIKILRVKKLEKIAMLKMLNKEIRLLIVKLKKAFPVAEYRVKIGQEEKRVRKGSKSVMGGDLYSLESELKMIEQKIGKLG
jgi:hypothetical protein